MSAETNLPRTGMFGMNIIVGVIFNFLYRMSNKKNAEFMSMLGVRISVGTICSILLAMCGRPGIITRDNGITEKMQNNPH